MFIFSCMHLFHFECIMEWLLEHNECPICKYDYKKESQFKNKQIPNIINNQNHFINNTNLININHFNFNGRESWRGGGHFRGRGHYRGVGNYRGRGSYRGRGNYAGRGNYRGRGNHRGRGNYRGRGIH